VQVEVPATGEYVSFVVGANKCDQCASVSDAECIQRLSFNPSAIASCYGDRPIRTARLILALVYMALLVSFGAMVGILNIQQMKRSARK
jgi:hypothetical protein